MRQMLYELPPEKDSSASFELLAQSLYPTLHRWTRRPQRLISFAPCQDTYFGYRIEPSSHSITQLATLAWGRDSDFVLDFGIHMVGFLSFRLSCIGSNMDAPCRLRITFGESPLDVTSSMDGVETWLSKAWLPDEIINVDICPEDVKIRRRHAFRFLRIQVVDTSRNFKVAFSNVACDCISTISQCHELTSVKFDDQILQDIDRVSILTLRDCMQSVFEDGPRRDRRMWIGDLRLQALANYATFKDFNLVKRCLFQFAAVAREDGSLPACLFEKPALSASADYLTEYDALFGSIVYDYVAASGDIETGQLLWKTTLECVRRPLRHVDPQTGIFKPDRTSDKKFLDWNRQIDTTAGSHGVVLFSLKAIAKLALILQLDFPYHDTIAKMNKAAQTFLVDGTVVSGPNFQISYASVCWLVLAETFTLETARDAILKTLAHPAAIKPMTPYLWHHVCEALVKVGCDSDCLDILRLYWGGMVKAGADTFWECYDPANVEASPYGDVRMNSFCHAWSCTPTYLLRGQLLDKINGEVDGKITMGELDDITIDQSVGKA